MSRINRKTLAALLAIVIASVTACASNPDRPERQLARAETGIEFAEENGAPEYGAEALERARNHLAVAQDAADAGDYFRALRAAEKAEIDAKLAAAQANRFKAEDALAEIHESIETLRREIARQSAG